MAGELNAYAVTPSDTVDDPNGVFSELYIGTSGDVTLITAGGATVLYKACPAGERLQIRTRRVKVTGTTATNIVGQV
jgi:hypothetical protein